VAGVAICCLLGGLAPAAPPSNDECSGATPVALGAVAYSTVEATTSLLPPPCASISRDLWYSIVATADGTLTVTNCGQPPSGYDTVIALYAGVDCAALTQLACSDAGGACGFDEASVSAAVQEGQSYFIRFGGFGGAAGQAGTFLVSLTPPPANDSCSGALPLALDTPIIGTTVGAANDHQVTGTFAGVGQIAPAGAAGRDVVYVFTAPEDGLYSFRVSHYASGNPVLYLSETCPEGSAPQLVAVIAGANRTGAGTFAAEEVPCVGLSADQQVFVIVDETAPVGSSFRLEVIACTPESPGNDAPASAGVFAPGMQGSIAPAGDVDFVSLGVLPAGSRVFAMVDGVAAGSTDFDLRVTTSSDTLEYDDADNDAPFGGLSPNCSGTPTPAAETEIFLRISHFSPTVQAEPWRLHASVQPPLAEAATEEEPNDTLAQANFSLGNYWYGEISSAGDGDLYVFSALAGQIIHLAVDGDPLRDGTPINAALALLDGSGGTLVSVGDLASTSSTASGLGSLTSTSPSSPGEAIIHRAATSGTFAARVSATAAGDYLLSITTSSEIAPEYCEAASEACAVRSDEYIASVAIGDVLNSSSAEGACFSSFVDEPPATLLRTSGATITVINGNPAPESACTVWCDWNRDGSFSDPGEEFALFGGPDAFTGSIVPPQGALLGETRLRVRLYDSGTDPTPTPCGGAARGEVEDYTVIVAPAPAAPTNDLCAQALVVGNGSFGGTTVNATLDGGAACDPGGAGSRDVWYAYTAAFDGLLLVDTCGSAVDTVVSVHSACDGSELACSDDCAKTPCGAPASCLSISLTAGEAVRIRVSDQGGEPGSFTLTTDLALLNDLCSGAVLVAVPSATPGTTVGSTLDGGLPECAPVAPSPGNNGGSIGYSSGSVWYRVVGTGGTIIVDTLSASFDTRLHVFAGACGQLTCVTANDDISPGFRSKVAFRTALGSDYFILVSAFSTASGSFTLNVAGADTPANDDCAGAMELGISGSVAGTTLGATGEGFAPASNLLATCATNTLNPLFDVWYSWTAPCNATLTLSTCGSYDTLLSVHALCPTFTLGNQIAGLCNDDAQSGCEPGSQISFAATGGTTYLIRVAGAVGAEAGGEFTLLWSLPDADEDGTPDCLDGCPLDPDKIAPGVCGCGISDVDSDGDGTSDCLDGCPLDPEKIAPGLCGCGVSDVDSDGDSTPDCSDLCPRDPLKIEPGTCGCGVSDLDSDKDGVPDCDDGCPLDPAKIAPGICGCGVADIDSDGDGTADCNDECPTDPNKTTLGVCGCFHPDVDSDGDGLLDCIDGCPNDPSKIDPGVCGCGVADTDTDGDGLADCLDECPEDPEKILPGVCGCNTPDTDSDGDGIADCVDECPGFDDSLDCNANGVPDGCDIIEGRSLDLNGSGVPDECECLADLSGDGVVNGADLGLMLAAWNAVGENSADLNFDGVVGGADLGLLLSAWGVCP
jgi:hypothetical protein